MNLVTTTRTSLPIGRSGYFFPEDTKINDMGIIGTSKIAGSLWKIQLSGVKFIRDDETGKEYGTCFDLVIFDADDQKIHPGYCKKISKSLFAIFDTPSTLLSWPTDDAIVIKNIQTGKKKFLEPKAPTTDGKVTKDQNLFILEGELWSEEEKLEHWRAFVNPEGQIVYEGPCWSYQINDNKLKIKKTKTSKKCTTKIISLKHK